MVNLYFTKGRNREWQKIMNDVNDIVSTMNSKDRKLLGLHNNKYQTVEENQKIVTCMVIGYPSVKYQRTVPRNEAKVTWK